MKIRTAGMVVVSALVLSACNSNLSGFFGTERNPPAAVASQATVTPVPSMSAQTQNYNQRMGQPVMPTPTTTAVDANSPMPGVVGSLPAEPNQNYSQTNNSGPALYNNQPSYKAIKHKRETISDSSLPPMEHGQYNDSGANAPKM